MPPLKNDQGLYEVDIDGVQYMFAKWGAEESLEAMLDIAGIVGRPMAILSAYLGTDQGAKAPVTPAMVDDIMQGIVATLNTNRANVLRLFKKVGSKDVLADGKPIRNFDLHYKDKLGHLFRVCRAGLEVQYGDFLHDLSQREGFKAVLQVAASPPTHSPGGL